MIIVTGAAGFIGSVLVRALNDAGHEDLVLVDDFSNEERNKNLTGKKFQIKVDLWEFPVWLQKNEKKLTFIFHLGGKTDTTIFDPVVFEKYNVGPSKTIWNFSTENNIPFVYASSAATYGGGEQGYADAHELIHLLRPLNHYGQSKQDFDLWALNQKTSPPFWAGLKFFNAYGPNEYHKSRMASVAFHSFNQIQREEKVKLFRHGEQERDFVYVKDIAAVCLFLMKNRPASGIYNAGTGKARSFKSLAEAVFAALKREPKIEYIDIPPDIREKYQSFTEAKVDKLRAAGYDKRFTSLEDGVKDYIQNHLLPKKYL